jgi:hypothetical protein
MLQAIREAAECLLASTNDHEMRRMLTYADVC